MIVSRKSSSRGCVGRFSHVNWSSDLWTTFGADIYFLSTSSVQVRVEIFEFTITTGMEYPTPEFIDMPQRAESVIMFLLIRNS